MKRRSFLQWCLGVLGVGTVGVPAVKAVITPKDWQPFPNLKKGQKIKWRKWADIQCPCDRCQQVKILADRQHTAIYVGRQFRAKDRRVKWSKVGIKEQMWIRYDYDEFSYIDFSADTIIIAINNIKGRLIVDCEHSIWEIEENVYGDGFQRKLISYL